MKLNPRIAASVALAMALGAGAAQAATLATVPVNLSQQGQALSGNAAAYTLPAITVTLGADYSVNDNITLRIAGATVGGATNANLLTPANIACSGPDDIIVSFITRNGNDISLRVTQKNVQNTVNVTCTIQNVQVTAQSLAVLTDVTASWSATTAITNIPFDPSVPVTVASVKDQFNTNGVVALNGVVDVNVGSLRTKFVGDDGAVFAGNEDTLTVVANNIGPTLAAPVAQLNSVVVTVNGNFSHVDSNSDGDCSNDALAGFLSSSTGTVAVAANCQSLTITDVNGVTATYNLTFGPNGSKVLVAPQTFTGSVRYNYTAAAPGVATGNESDNFAPGAWTLNGFQAFVNYMPYGGNVSQIIYLANKGTQSGAIQVDARNEAGTACSFAAGTISSNRVSVLSGAVKTGIENCYGVGFTGKVHMTITANIPSVDGEVYSAYNVGGNDRGTVVNTSNGR